jgi:synaptosomal-associated protein 29
MAGRQYLTDSNSPFFSVDEEDVDDETFLRHNSYCREKSAVEDKRLQLLERKKAIEERTIQSSERSIRLLQDTEQIGVATGEVAILLSFRLCATTSVFHYSYA